MGYKTVGAQETMQFKSEVTKLDFIRHMLKKETYLRRSEYNTARCIPMMKDLLAGEHFKAIEPYLRADSLEDPRIARWNQCRQIDYHDVGVEAEKFFGWLPELGAPPYRFYRIELDGDYENGPEDMVYFEQPSDPNTSGNTGYAWVDLKRCEIKYGFPIGPLFQISKKKKVISLNTLVYYKGLLWAIDYEEGFSFNMQRRIDHEKIETCQWWLFDPKKANIRLTGEHDNN